jgi:hypothetical protein
LEIRPVREICPDCLIVGVRPEYPTSLLAVANLEMSPISHASVRPSSSLMPGMVIALTEVDHILAVFLVKDEAQAVGLAILLWCRDGVVSRGLGCIRLAQSFARAARVAIDDIQLFGVEVLILVALDVRSVLEFSRLGQTLLEVSPVLFGGLLRGGIGVNCQHEAAEQRRVAATESTQSPSGVLWSWYGKVPFEERVDAPEYIDLDRAANHRSIGNADDDGSRRLICRLSKERRDPSNAAIVLEPLKAIGVRIRAR